MTHNGIFLDSGRDQAIRDGIRMTAAYRRASEDDALTVELAMATLVRRAAIGANFESMVARAINAGA